MVYPKEVRRILRDFINRSIEEIEGKGNIPHIGNDLNCKLCKIEKRAIRKIIKLYKR